MNDDWRLRIDLHEHGFARQLSELLTGGELEHDLKRAFRDRIVVSVDGGELFCYTGSRQQAEQVEQLVRRLAAAHEWTVHIRLAHWHPAAERWEDPDLPLQDAATARAERIDQEREASAERGYPEFEVRVEFRGAADARQLASRLRAQDIPCVHRWSYVLVGAVDEDSARALAQRTNELAPTAVRVTVERNERAIYDDLPRSPFSVLGGLGG